MARWFLVTLMLAASPGWAADALQGNVCAAQIAEYVAGKFGHTVKSIEFRYRSQQGRGTGGLSMMTQAIVSVEECPGYYFFELNADDYACDSQAHVGKVPNYVIYRSAGDGC